MLVWPYSVCVACIDDGLRRAVAMLVWPYSVCVVCMMPESQKSHLTKLCNATHDKQNNVEKLLFLLILNVIYVYISTVISYHDTK